MRPAVVLDAVRTPLGGRGGALSTWHPADLAAVVLAALMARTGLDPALVDDVVLGCAMPVGNQGFNVARSAVLAAGWPDHVAAGTIDRQGVSSLAALATAARAVASGSCDVVVAGGVEVMSTTPPGATLVPGAQPFGPAMADRYRDRGGLVPPGTAAEALSVERAVADAYALRSHERAAASPLDPGAIAVGALKADELPRTDLTLAELVGARPAFSPDGTVTAANSAPMADGAAAVLVVSEAVAEASGATPLARIAAVAEVGVDPLVMLTGAVPATRRVLARAGVDVGDVERFEIGEPFAAVPLAWMAALGIDEARVNPAGGGIARGEATGAVGARLVVTLAHGLTGRWGLATTVATGGLGSALLLERP